MKTIFDGHNSSCIAVLVFTAFLLLFEGVYLLWRSSRGRRGHEPQAAPERAVGQQRPQRPDAGCSSSAC